MGAQSGRMTPSASAGTARKSAIGFDVRVKLLCLVVYSVATLHARTAPSCVACCAFALAVALAVRLRLKDVKTALKPLTVVLAFTALMQVLYLQEGAVLVQVGPVAVTREALVAAAVMVADLACIMLVSLAFMRVTPAGDLVWALDRLLAPLRGAGVRTGGFMISLSVAVTFVPVLVKDFLDLKLAQQCRLARFDGSVRERLSAYARLFPPLVRSSFRHADRLAESFLSRCFSGATPRSSLRVRQVGLRDIVCLVVCSLVAVAVFFVA